MECFDLRFFVGMYIDVYIMTLSFRTDRFGQTVQTQTRLLLSRSSLIRVFTVCYSIGMFLTKYPKVWAFCLNFRLITAKFSGIRKSRNFTVLPACDIQIQLMNNAQCYSMQ